MSIATLKRKTFAQYNNNSVGFSNFSINGTTRNQGYVGQDSRGRSLIKTPFVGNTPRGSSACCGHYPISIVYPSGINYFEDNAEIKSSVLSNSGSIATHYRWIRRPQPFATVKPDTNLSLNSSSGSRTTNLQRAVLNSIEPPVVSEEDENAVLVNNPYIYKYSNYQKKQLCPAITKTLGPFDQSTYLQNLESACINSTVVSVPYAVQKEPFQGFSISY